MTGVASTFRFEAATPLPVEAGAAATGAAASGAAATGSAAGSAPAPSPSISSTTRVSWTRATSPSLPKVWSTFPALGLGMVTVALSVITSTSAWSSAMTSPAFTSHLTISPSTTPSPMSGSLNSNLAIV